MYGRDSVLFTCNGAVESRDLECLTAREGVSRIGGGFIDQEIIIEQGRCHAGYEKEQDKALQV